MSDTVRLFERMKSPDGRDLISIPLPPRKRHRRRLRIFKRSPRKKSFLKTSPDTEFPPAMSPRTRERRRELFRSFIVALAVNVAIIACLSLGVHTIQPQEDFSVVVIKSIPNLEDKSDKPSDSSSSSSAPAKTKIPTTVAPTVTSKTLSSFALPSFEIPSLEENFSGGSFDWGIGKEGRGSGIGGKLGAAFSGKGIGDGSEMVLYLDVSGSMREHSKRVAGLVGSSFPNARIVEIRGCSILGNSQFVRELNDDLSNRSKVFFVCDLRDKVDKPGLFKLRDYLMFSEIKRELHIISFAKKPNYSLNFLIEKSGGSFVFMGRE